MEWLEILSTDTEALKNIDKEYNIHPLAMEDCMHRDQRPKIDDYGNHQLLVWFMYTHGQFYELQFLIFSDTLILVPHEPPPGGDSWKNHLKVNTNTNDVWYILYQALDRATDITWQEIRKLYSKVDEFEEEMFKKDINPQLMVHLKKQFNQFDYMIGHLPAVAQQLRSLCKQKEDLNWKLRDLYDHCERIYQSILLYRSQIATTIELFWGLHSNRTNKQIKKLSLLASIAVPLTFWASFWGMNFQVIPFDKPELFYIAIVLMLLSVAGTTWLLVRKGYWSY